MPSENIRHPETETILETYRGFAIVDNSGGYNRDGTLYARQDGTTAHSRVYGTASTSRDEAVERLKQDIDEYEYGD